MILPSSLVIPQGWGLIDLPLRASNEGLLRPRVARAQKIIRLHPLLCSKHLLRGMAKAALYCAHRATTASSWGLCEQEGHLAAPSPLSNGGCNPCSAFSIFRHVCPPF